MKSCPPRERKALLACFVAFFFVVLHVPAQLVLLSGCTGRLLCLHKFWEAQETSPALCVQSSCVQLILAQITSVLEQTEATPRMPSIGAAPVVVARCVAMIAAIGEAAPEENQDGRYNNRTDERDTVQQRFVSDVKVQHSHDQKNGQEPHDNRA